MKALLVSLLLSQAYYTPEEAQALFQEANALYGKGDLAAACERYERLIAHGRGGPDVLYNLGTAYLAQGKLGEAVLNLERARRLGGGDPDVEGNLAIARARQLDQVTGEAVEEPIASRLAEALPQEPLGWVFAGVWALGWLGLAVAERVRGNARFWARLLAVLLFAAGAMPSGALLATVVYTARTVKEGVVLEPTLPVRELPSPEAKVSFEVHAGLKVRLLKNVGDYVRIRLPNGLEAWAVRNAVAPL